MNLSFNGGTQQQRSWFERAMSRCRYDFTALDADVRVSWPAEPSCPGHKEYACTHWNETDSRWEIEIRATLDADVSSLFYDETCVHELGHVAWFVKTAEGDRQALCPHFYRDDPTGRVVGEAADLNPLDSPWDQRIQETMAEIFKDAVLPDSSREYDNRTQWKVVEDQWATVLAPLFAGSGGGGGGSGGPNLHEVTVTWSGASVLDYFNSDGLPRVYGPATNPDATYQAQAFREYIMDPLGYPQSVTMYNQGTVPTLNQDKVVKLLVRWGGELGWIGFQSYHYKPPPRIAARSMNPFAGWDSSSPAQMSWSLIDDPGGGWPPLIFNPVASTWDEWTGSAAQRVPLGPKPDGAVWMSMTAVYLADTGVAFEQTAAFAESFAG